jgi:glucokinase
VQHAQEQARARGFRLAAAGVGFPGVIDTARGEVVAAPPQIPQAEGLPLARLLEDALGVRAVAENDANCAAWGEATAGAGQGCASVLTVTIGTGLGGGLVLDGHLLRGAFGTGGEIGHMIYEPAGRACPFNGRGCLELYASATALRRIYRSWGGRERSAHQIAEQAREGEGRAEAALREMAEHLGCGLASAANLVGFERIVVGGGVAAAGGVLFEPLRAAFRARALPILAARCEIVPAKLGNQAGLVGAALLGFQAAGERCRTPAGAPDSPAP